MLRDGVGGRRSPSVRGLSELVSPGCAGGGKAEGVLVDVPEEEATAAVAASP